MQEEGKTQPLRGDQLVLMMVLVLLSAILAFVLGFWAGRQHRVVAPGSNGEPVHERFSPFGTKGGPPSASENPPIELAQIRKEDGGVRQQEAASIAVGEFAQRTIDQEQRPEQPPPSSSGEVESAGNAHPGETAHVTRTDAQAEEYTVQVGAFLFRSQAEDLAQSLRRHGYSVWVKSPPPGRFFLVWLGRFSSEERAERFARRSEPLLKSLAVDGYRVRTTRR